MVEHLGHLVQRPSGISRFLDFPVVSLGFLTNAVSGLPFGGVTPGSTVVSTPRLFFVNDVDAISRTFGPPIQGVQCGIDRKTTGACIQAMDPVSFAEMSRRIQAQDKDRWKRAVPFGLGQTK